MKPPQALASPPRVAVHSLFIFHQPFPQFSQGKTFVISLPHHLFLSFVAGIAVVIASFVFF